MPCNDEQSQTWYIGISSFKDLEHKSEVDRELVILAGAAN